MKHLIKILFIALVINATIGNSSMARQSAYAVMEVRVEVISGAHLQSNMQEDISTQLTEAEHLEESGECKVSLGQVTLTTPEGTPVIISIENEIVMKDGAEELPMSLAMNEQVHKNGERNIEVSGRADLTNIHYGSFMGDQITRIEYD